MYRSALFRMSPAVAFAVVLTACDNDKPRSYTEIASQPLHRNPLTETLNTSPVDVQVQWVLPPDWVQKDSSNGIRAGSFAIPDSNLAHMGELDPDAIDVSITHFAGDAGGLDANIRRWMGQVNIKLDSAALADFIAKAESFKTATGESGIFVDLTEVLSSDLTQSKSIFGAVVPAPGYTLFVKAMGLRKRVSDHREDIRTFCRTLQLKAEAP